MVLNLSDISPLPISVVEFLKELTQNILIERLIIFGSRAMGDYEEYSDLDLAIDAPQMGRGEWIQLKENAYYNVKSVLQISLVNFAQNPERLKKRMIQEGKVIYERKKKN